MQDTNSTILIFLINGINSLLGWNAVLAALDYFQDVFKDYNIYSFLPIPVFIGYIIVGSTYHILSNKFKYLHLITAGNMGINISLISILLVSTLLPGEPAGFILLLFCAFLIGISSNLSQLSFFAMINYLSQSVVSKFTVGTAISGLFINLVRMIILAGFGTSNDSVIPIVIYFIIAMLFNTFDLLVNVKFIKSDVYKQKIQSSLTSSTQLSDQLNAKQESVSVATDQETVSQLKKQQKRIESQNYFKTLFETNKKLFPYPYIIMFTFVITFTLFPGPSFSKTFDGLDVSWSVMILLMSYNIGDTIGKYIAQFKGIFNKWSLIFIFFSRLLYFLPITVMANGEDDSDPLLNNYFFPFFNQLLFAISNGFCINASFIMAFKVCPDPYKKYAGVFCGLILQVGIILGTIIEVPFAYIIGLG